MFVAVFSLKLLGASNVDIDWGQFLVAFHSVTDGWVQAFKMWLKADRVRQWTGIMAISGVFSLLVPLAFAFMTARTIKLRSTHRYPYARIPVAQAVDLWYQESRRAMDAKAASVKTNGTFAGLGLASAATIAAISGAPTGLLYLGAALNVLALSACSYTQIAAALMHGRHARAFSSSLRGADADDTVDFAVGTWAGTADSRRMLFATLLAMGLSATGWLNILCALLLTAIPKA